MIEVAYTHHAERRAQQRGVPPSLIDTVLLHADMELPIGKGRVALRLSSEAAHCLRQETSATVADQAKDLVLILSGAVLLTVLHAQGQPSRHYRRRR